MFAGGEMRRFIVLAAVAAGSSTYAIPTEVFREDPTCEDAAPTAPAADVHAGRELFQRNWLRDDPRSYDGDGLGPVSNASSCAACHNQGGAGGAGSRNVEVAQPTEFFDLLMVRPPRVDVIAESADLHPFLVGELRMVLSRSDSTLPRCATQGSKASTFTTDVEVIHGHLRPGAGTDECVAGVLLQLRVPFLPDGNVRLTITLAPKQEMHRREPKPTPPTPRNTPALFGLGLIDELPDAAIEDLARTSYVDHPEVTGRVVRTPDGRPGRFGWKGDVGDLSTFVARACANELGLEVPGVAQPGAPAPGWDLSERDLDDLTAFLRSVPRPEQRDGALVHRGGQRFRALGCATCHAPDVGAIDGLYSDLLVHDLGPESSDAAPAYGGPRSSDADVAAPVEWRTPPLWGVRDSAPYLHDGRAASLNEAILAHGGEARLVRRAYEDLPAADAEEVAAFLESLTAP